MKTRTKWVVGATSAVAVVITVIAVVAYYTPTVTPSSASPSVIAITATPTPTPTPDMVATAQCRANALNAYAQKEGFATGQYTVDALNTSESEVYATGSEHFWSTVDSRTKLGQLFASKDAGAVAQQSAQLAHFAPLGYSSSTILNANNWGTLQSLVPSYLGGNFGFVDGAAHLIGTRVSGGGDAVWLFIDPNSCTVPLTATSAAQVAVAKTSGATIQLATLSVGLIRVACSNIGSYLSPKDWSLSVAKPSSSITVHPNNPLTGTPVVVHPAPVQPVAPAANPSSPAADATPGPGSSTSSPGTGTTNTGGAGNVNGSTGGNTAPITNPFGGG